MRMAVLIGNLIPIKIPLYLTFVINIGGLYHFGVYLKNAKITFTEIKIIRTDTLRQLP